MKITILDNRKRTRIRVCQFLAINIVLPGQ